MNVRMPSSLRFGAGRLDELGEVVREQGISRPLIVADASLADVAARARAILQRDGLDPGVWREGEPNPTRAHVERCREAAAAAGADGLVAVGGGSVIDVAKAASALLPLDLDLRACYGLGKMRAPGPPVIAVPTTAGSGADVSSHAVIVEPETGKKEVVSGLPLLPAATLIDPALTVTLSPALTLQSALDGLVHAVEVFVARAATPFTDLLARAAIPMIRRALPEVVARPGDVGRRETLGLGCLYAGIGMANANAGIIHALGYPLTSEFGIPHGLANALMAPAALVRTWRAAPERYAGLASLLAGDARDGDPARLGDQVRRLLVSLSIVPGLARYGVTSGDPERLADLALEFGPVLANTWQRVTREDLRDIYAMAVADE